MDEITDPIELDSIELLVHLRQLMACLEKARNTKSELGVRMQLDLSVIETQYLLDYIADMRRARDVDIAAPRGEE